MMFQVRLAKSEAKAPESFSKALCSLSVLTTSSKERRLEGLTQNTLTSLSADMPLEEHSFIVWSSGMICGSFMSAVR